MKYPSLLLSLCFLLFLTFPSGRAMATPTDIYIVFYVTQNGVTGHVGIAVDNYDIRVRDTWQNGRLVTLEDTVANGTLSFFDLWPKEEIKMGQIDQDLTPQYFRHPRTSAEDQITVESILNTGLPYGYRLPCDGLLRIRTTATEDFRLEAFIDSMPDLQPVYNSLHFNCTDFVIECLQRHFGFAIQAREYIPVSWVSTPNTLYRWSIRHLPVEVLRDPGPKVNGSFFKERILTQYLSLKHSDNEND